MQRRNIINTVMILSVASLLLFLAFRVKIPPVADTVAVFSTKGMTCASCTEKVSRALAGWKGIAATEVDQTGGVVFVGYERKSTGPEEIAARISAAGFDSTTRAVMTPEQFRQASGREFGRGGKRASGCGCCGSRKNEK